MYRILKKKELNPSVVLMEIEAPLVAQKAEPGQFIILRVDEFGERIPLTIADYDRARGTITIIFQLVGTTTRQLSCLKEGDTLMDFAGPLGVASHLNGFKKSRSGWRRRWLRHCISTRPKSFAALVPMWMSSSGSVIRI